MIKLIATDMDGTVLGPDFRFRPRTLEAIAAAQEAGIEIVFVTGRPHRWLDPLWDQLKYDSVAICSNGAVVYDLARDEVLESELVDGEVVLDLMGRLRRRLPRAKFCAETLEAVLEEENWGRTNLVETGDVEVGPIESRLDPSTGVIKLLVKDESMQPRELYEEVLDEAGDAVSVTHALANLPLAEIGQPGLSKGRTLARWCAERGITADQVAAFGDMPNDTEMLRWATHGYAMGGGWPEVIEAVGRTCPPFEEDGVAQTIERLIAEQSGQAAPTGSPAATERA